MDRNLLGIGIAGTTLSQLERRLLETNTPCSVVLFARNIETPEQLRSLVREIKSHGGDHPPLVMIDEEGGHVDRLGELVSGIPGAGDASELADPEAFARRLGERIGEALRFFEIDVNLAPVVDIERNSGGKGLDGRTWGKTAEEVVSRAGAFMKGHHEFGAATCLKHFPGLGAGKGDPHYGPSVVKVSSKELEDVDLVPYRRLAAEAGAVMIGHSLYPAIEDPDLPASLSRRVSTGLLREVLEFEGVSISDDMEMHATADLGTFEEIGDRAVLAGNDVVLFCAQIERVPDILSHMERRLDEDPAFEARYEQALDRADEFRSRCLELRSESRQPRELDEIRAGFDELRKEIEAATGRVIEKRKQTGSGSTGREEWT
ncbi:MAG: glycoside hydrolase family 3 N-terminal domain-containing protein [Thermoanaerobaculia bacterium]|nr:glycoside hydrolase family 3 N-terminal domain-containing protein [Thermoanaerobaculia bacterium]